MPHRRIVKLLAAAALALVACDKSEPLPPEPQATTTTVASASASSQVLAAPSPASAEAPSAAPAAAGDSGVACGEKPLPDCPLQAWMKKNTKATMAAGDLPGAAKTLEATAKLAPPGYLNWSSIAKDGAKAARAGDLDGTKASCRSCHRQYKKRYKTELRARPISAP